MIGGDLCGRAQKQDERRCVALHDPRADLRIPECAFELYEQLL